MPAPVALLALAALAGVAAVAASSKKGASAPSSGTYTLDANLPPSTLQQVLGAIANTKDPSALLLFATQMDAAGFPLAANALRMRAAMLTPGAPLPDPNGLDGNMDPTTKAAVLQALATESDPGKLMTFAGTIQLQYPIAAGLLVAKAQALGGGTPGQAAQPGIPVANPVAAPTAVPTAAPALPAAAPVFIAPMAPAQPSLPSAQSLFTPALNAEVTAALASTDPNAVNQAWNDLNLAAAPLGGAAAAFPSLSAQLKALVQQLLTVPGTTPSLDNVLPPRPAPVPMPAPNPTPLGAPAPPPAGTTWVLATNADVARDGTAARYQSLLSSSPVGTEVHETYNGDLWKLRVISSTTDPGLTTYAKDVKGWIARPSAVVTPAAPPPPPAAVPVAPTVQPAIVPPAPAPPAAPTQNLTGVQQAAVAMANALNTNGYRQADQGLYKAFQSAAGMTADGFPGRGTMQTNAQSLTNVLAQIGQPPPNVPVYTWHSMPGTTGYDGVNAPTWAQWSGSVTVSGGRYRNGRVYA
jgi:hypothetical protein